MIHLTSQGLRGLVRKLESGPARSIAISATAGAVGLAAGKLEDARKTPLVAVAAGAGLTARCRAARPSWATAWARAWASAGRWWPR